MEWLNYHHLRYFWVVVREGGLVPAGRLLRVSHPTLSAQIHALEEQLGEKLFHKVGRRLVLTELGQVVYRYASEIFALGGEMLDAVRGRSTGKPLHLNVGIVDVVPKLIARRLIQPALSLDQGVRIVCREGSYTQLLADLVQHTLDVVIADAPAPPESHVRVFSHLLGETSVSLLASEALALARSSGFPGSLDGAPFLLPMPGIALRRLLDPWFAKRDIAPDVVAEFEDSALMKVFGGDGLGIFPAPRIIERDVMRQHAVCVVGRIPEIRERFYAVSVERRLKHPAVVALCDAARGGLFADARGA